MFTSAEGSSATSEDRIDSVPIPTGPCAKHFRSSHATHTMSPTEVARMKKEIVLIVVFLLVFAGFAVGPLRPYLPDSVERGIERLVEGARMNVQGPTTVGR